MRFRILGLTSIGLVAVFASPMSGLAADLDPVVEVVDNFQSCFYARVDGGGAFHTLPRVSNTAGVFGGSGNNNALDEEIANLGFVEAGAGCQVTDHMRVEVTGGYRMKASLTDPFGTLNADLQTYTGFGNVFWDITNYGGFTPYLGFGLGVAYHTLSGITAPAGSSSNSKASFAYNLSAGLSYDFTDNMQLDIGYRYVDLGKTRAKGADPIKVEKIRAHEIKAGVRFNFNSW